MSPKGGPATKQNEDPLAPPASAAAEQLDPKAAAGTNTSPSGRRGRRGSKARARTIRILITELALLVAFFGLWQIAVSAKWIDELNYGSPAQVWTQFREWATDGTLVSNLLTTLLESAVGFAIGVAAAIPIGMALARSIFWDRVFRPFVDMINSTPRFALAPLFILLLGIGIETKIVLVLSIVFFIMLVNTMAGVKSVNEDYVRLAKICGASRRELLSKVILPATGGYIMAGLRLSVPYALAGAVVGEMLAGSSGLGYLVSNEAGLLNMSGVLTAVLVLAVIGWIVNTVVNLIVRRTPWSRTDVR